MLKVRSIIEKENNLEESVKENNHAIRELLMVINEIAKKKPETIRYALCSQG